MNNIMKWPGLIPLIGRIIALPFVLLFAAVIALALAVGDGMEWWLDRVKR